jgi:hypothetical protein
VAATKNGLFAAALALPGLGLTLAAHAEALPSATTVELQYSHYQEFQSRKTEPSGKRMEISAPSIFVLAPVGENWSASGFLTTDSMSGASPLWHDTLSGASGEGVEDFRKALSADVTRYFERASVSVGGAFSTENDYKSSALSVSGTLASADNNTTYSAGIGVNRDRIDSVGGLAVGERKRGNQLSVGISKVLSANSIFAASLGFAHGTGYFNDPYKPLDTRPNGRDETTLLLRYNQYFAGPDAALRLNYRFYTDTWAVRGHTLDAAWEQPLTNDFILTPSLRFYSQSAADFYINPPFGIGYAPGRNYSADSRLSAFGAWDVGFKVGFPEFQGWRPELKFEFYRQRNSWALGKGSTELAPLSARTWQLGLKKSF